MASTCPPLRPPAEFLREAQELDIAFDEGDLERMGRYLAHLLQANRQFNLTAITDPAEAWRRHVLDSLTLLPLLVTAQVRRVADIGSGAGLPGVPLAIAMPDVSFVLLEATGKKARFIEQTAQALGLTNVEVVGDRVETAAHDRQRHRERYDAVVARAVGPLAVLLELAVPLSKVGGWVLAIKGRQAHREIAESARALELLHAEVIGTTGTPTGTIVIVQKHRRTPRPYPRRPGEPKRAPLR